MRLVGDGIFLVGRPHGETSVIADIFTRENGRTLGLIKGGRSRRIRPLLQTGNRLKVEWRARLEDQLGVYTVELDEATTATILDDELALAGVMSLAALLQALPERDPHPGLFEAALNCLGTAGTTEFSVSLLRFELRFLEEQGFGLDLSKCAATGQRDDLIYVSPRSGQAVSREAGEPFRDKLLPLPQFLIKASDKEPPSVNSIMDGFTMTGHFLAAHVFSEPSKPMPKARDAFTRLLCRLGHNAVRPSTFEAQP
jgi:DNA repair protein RecO (recombination protein O)